MSEEDDSIFKDEDMEEDTNYKAMEVNSILVQRGINIKKKKNESIIKDIENFHKELKIVSVDLMKKIVDCYNNGKIDYDNITKVANLSIKNSFSSEIINNLIEFYDFISDQNLNQNDISLIYKEDYFSEIGNFKDILQKMKLDVIVNKFQIEDEYIKKLYKNCIEMNWNFNKIQNFYLKIKNLNPKKEKGIQNPQLEKIKEENEQKLHIIESLSKIITAFPDIKIEDMNDINFDNLSIVARDFYLKCSSESKEDINPLSIKELLNSLRSLNENYFDEEKINELEEQVKICNNMKNIIKPKDIKKWIEEELIKYNFEKKEEKYINVAKTLGVISIGLYHSIENEKEKYYLREVQLLAILIFIDNNGKSNGIIEEIATGEGKSAIISCLAAYFGLRKHKVDIITSSRTLAERDAIKYKNFYNIFGLESDNCKNYNPAPYKADIVYGTFLDFEGDLLDEISNSNIIRGDRPYDIIIIDEVDNMFIDGIKGSTQLTRSSKGYQFLIPIYLQIYLFIDILDHLYLEEFIKQFDIITSQNNYQNLSDGSKKKIINKINDENERKNIFLKYVKKIFKEFLEEVEKKNPKYANSLKEDINKINKINSQEIDEEDEYTKLKKFFTYPTFLKDFVESQMYIWQNSAYMAKNVFKKETHYTISSKRNGYDTITPIDRKNTGELELNTVYRNGLHQMLQVKEKVKVQSQSLTHTFLSHITYFQNFKKGNFFGLTGTIGGRETYTIYKSKYFNSDLVRIPQFKRKRFIELPAIICENDIEKHLAIICKEIIYHFSKGRKILVICKDINEGNNIELKLKEGKFEQKDFDIKIDENYKKNIFLYLRNDLDNLENDLKNTTKRIILSTNLGGRGTDIGTTLDIENKGGLHVILTKLSQNSRTQKQAFGRTSRQGKKGSGQFIITEKRNYKTYNKLIENRDEIEEKRLKEINLDYLLLEDELFFKYIKHLKKYPELKDNEEGYYLKSDIDERWSFFLKKYVKENEERDKITKQFDIFLEEIDKIMKFPRYERFNNYFLRISEGLNRYNNFNPKLEKYFNFENNGECFYFTVSYYKAFIEHKKYIDFIDEDVKNIKDDRYCKKIIENFKKAYEQIQDLKEINIEPTLKSFVDWDAVSTIDKFFIQDKSKKNYEDSDFYKQFENRKSLLDKLGNHINTNIETTEEYIKKYLPKNKKSKIIILDRENFPINKLLSLDKEEENNLDYLYDSGFYQVYKLIIKKPVIRRNFKFWLTILGYFLLVGLLSYFVSPFAGYIVSMALRKGVVKILRENVVKEYVDIHEKNSIYSLIKSKFNKIFKNQNQNEENINENMNRNFEVINENNQDDDLNKEEVAQLKKKIIEDSKMIIISSFNEKIKTILEEIKFLLFIDEFNKENLWHDKIINILINSFNNYTMLNKKNEIIKMFNKKSEYENGKQKLKKLIEDSISDMIEKIKLQLLKKDYNEKEGITCFEHLIKKICFGELDDNSCSIIVSQILSQNIIKNDGNFNKNLFKINEKYNQSIKIFFNTPYPLKIKKIKNIYDFSLEKKFEVPIKNDTILQDIQLFYINREYKNPELLIFKDFTNKIRFFLIKVFELVGKDITNDLNCILLNMKKRIFEIIKTYFKEEIYPNILISKGKTKSIQLNKEEEEIFNMISEVSGKEALNSMKSGKYKQIFS